MSAARKKLDVARFRDDPADALAARAVALVSLLVAYVAGFLVASLLFLPFMGQLALIVLVGGPIIAAPVLSVAILVLLVFYRSIRLHLVAWCVAAPPIAAALWIAFDLERRSRAPGIDLWSTSEIMGAAWQGLLPLLCASIAAVVFYWMERGSKCRCAGLT